MSLATILVVTALAGTPKSDAGSDPVTLRIRLDTETVAPGASFTLTVSREFQEDLVPGPWDESVFEVIHGRRLDEERTRQGDRIEERRTYECRALRLTPFDLGELTFHARTADGTTRHESRVTGFTIPIQPTLDPESPGNAELPGGLLEPLPTLSRWPRVMFAWTLVLGVVAVRAWWRSRRRRIAEARDRDPDLRARHRLAALQERLPLESDIQAFYVEAAALVRDYLGDVEQAPTRERTSEQLVQLAEGAELPHARSVALRHSLQRCDRVKFGRAHPAAPEHHQLIAELSTFLEPGEDTP